MGYEKIIGDAILGITTPEQGAMKAAHLYAVQRAMFCECGQVLDVDKSVYGEVKETGKPFIICAACYERMKDKLNTIADAGLVTLDKGKRIDRTPRKRK